MAARPHALTLSPVAYACNVYKELDQPERVFEHIEEYREQQV